MQSYFATIPGGIAFQVYNTRDCMSNRNLLIWFLAILQFILPFVLQSSYYEPHRDEFLYLAEGQHPAWGFMEVPPLLSVFAWLVHFFGNGFFWIKCWPSLFGALTFVMVAKTIVSLGGKSFAVLLGWLPFITGAYLRVHFLFQPNFLEIFFWTAISCSLILFVVTGQTKWVYLFGASAGLGMLSKYSVAFIIAATIAGLLLTRQRRLFTNKHFYGAALLAFVIFLPNLIWQYSHHFPVVYHMQELKQTQLQYTSPAGFLTEQLLMSLPTIFIWLAGLGFVFFAKAGRSFQFIGWAYVTVIVLLLAGQGKGYYALGAYPVLFALGACWLEQLTSRLKVIRYALILVSLVAGGYILPLLLPIFEPVRLAAYYEKHDLQKTGSLKWEDLKNHPLPQDFADMLAWKEMTKKMAVAYQSLSEEEKKATFLFCDNYGQAGAVNYYGSKYHLPMAFSDNASFLYWIPDTLNVENLVLITDDKQEMQHSFIKNFKSAVLADSVTSAYARENGSLIIVLKGADATFKKFFREKLAKDKARVRK